MPIEVERAAVTCNVCGARVAELRRGRCWGCYTQWSDMRPVGKGADCAICHERRRDMLRLMELHGRSVPLCHGCASRALKMGPVPPTLRALRSVLRRERRADERRQDGRDRRLFPRERRTGKRRDDAASTPTSVAAGTATAPAPFADLNLQVIELDETDIDIIEQTLISQRPTR